MSDTDVEVLKKNVQKILNYLHNDEETGTKGLVAEVANLKSKFDEFIVSYKVEKAFKKGQITMLVFIGSCCGLLMEWLIKIIFK